MRSVGRWLIGFLLYGNILVAVAVFFATAATITIEDVIGPRGLEIFVGFESLDYLFVAVLATLSGYLFIRLVLQSPFATVQDHRATWQRHNRYLMIVMALAAGSGAIYLAVGMPWEAQVLLLVAAVLTILYAVPFVKIYGKRLSLRSAGYFKVFIISTVWALVTSFIPSGSFMLMLERFLFIFPLALVFDISDMEYDRNAGLLTFPTRFGVRTTKRIALGVLYLSAGVTLWNHSDPTIILPTLYSVALAIPVILLVNEQRKDWYFLVLVDGLITVQGLLLIWADWSP